MKYAKNRYKKANKLANGGYTGAIVGASSIAATAGSNALAKRAYNADGTVNSNKLQGAEALQYGAQGATMGSQFGAIGAGVGAVLGAGYGLYKGTNDAVDINNNVQGSKLAEYNAKIEEQKLIDKQKAETQDLFNRASNTINPTTGQQGASIYAKGGNLPKGDPSKTTSRTVNLNTDPFAISKDANPKSYNAFQKFLASKDLVGNTEMNTNEGRKKITESMINEFNTSSDHIKKYPNDIITTDAIKRIQEYHKLSDPNVVVDGWVGSETSQMRYPSMSTDLIAKSNDPKSPDYNMPAQDTLNVAWGNKKFKYASSDYVKNKGITREFLLDETGNRPFAPKEDVNLSTFKYDNGKTKTVTDKKAMGGYTKAPGGQLNHLASDTVQAKGNTHAEGGIDLMSNGKSYAEVEDNEVIKGTKVFSDRIKFQDGETIADKAEKFAKLKGKFEKKQLSPNYREKNAADRTTEFADRKLDELFNIQEASKNPVNNGQIMADGGDIVKGLSMVVPYIDNIYNNEMIKKTPDIPMPTEKQAYYAKAMPMKTTYDVSANIADANNALTNYYKNVDDNSSSSNVGRGNKLAAFASSLTNKNAIYQNKINVETQLQNANSKNMQDVNNANTANAQTIANTNLAQKDQYNYAKMQRQQDILNAKSANIGNAVNDAQVQIQDYNANKLDQERIMLDADKYTDGSGYAKMIGSKTMDDLVKNSSNYKRIEKALKTGKQEGALQDFYKKYGVRQ